MYSEHDPVIGRGTPCRPPSPQRCRIASGATEVPFRQFRSVELSAHTSVDEAAGQLSRFFEPHATPQAIMLTLALINRVEEDRMLAGFSSAVTAAACIQVAASALETKPLLSGRVLIGLNILPDPIRIAYNHIWLQRSKLESVIWSSGGDPGLLPSPTMANGKLDAIVFCNGVGIPVRPLSKGRPRHASFRSKSSPLRYVTYPPATPEESEPAFDVSADSDGDENWDKTSWESWKSSSSDDSAECDDSSGEPFGLGYLSSGRSQLSRRLLAKW